MQPGQAGFPGVGPVMTCENYIGPAGQREPGWGACVGRGQTQDSDPRTLPWTHDVLSSPTRSGCAPVAHLSFSPLPATWPALRGVWQEGASRLHLCPHLPPSATQGQYMHRSSSWGPGEVHPGRTPSQSGCWLVGVGMSLLPGASPGLSVTPH